MSQNTATNPNNNNNNPYPYPAGAPEQKGNGTPQPASDFEIGSPEWREARAYEIAVERVRPYRHLSPEVVLRNIDTMKEFNRLLDKEVAEYRKKLAREAKKAEAQAALEEAELEMFKRSIRSLSTNEEITEALAQAKANAEKAEEARKAEEEALRIKAEEDAKKPFNPLLRGKDSICETSVRILMGSMGKNPLVQRFFQRVINRYTIERKPLSWSVFGAIYGWLTYEKRNNGADWEKTQRIFDVVNEVLKCESKSHVYGPPEIYQDFAYNFANFHLRPLVQPGEVVHEDEYDDIKLTTETSSTPATPAPGKTERERAKGIDKDAQKRERAEKDAQLRAGTKGKTGQAPDRHGSGKKKKGGK